MLAVAGSAVATGFILNTITRTQTVTGVTMFFDADCNGVNGGNEQFASIALGQPEAFCLNVQNPSSSSLLVHVHMSAVCPLGGVAAVGDGPAPGDDLPGPDGVDACLTTPISGVSKTLAGAASASWNYNVTYGGSSGDYLWTFSAAQG